MCDQLTIERIDSGKYVAVPKWEHWLKLWTPITVIIVLLISTVIWVDDIEELGFDTTKQKENVLRYVENGHLFTAVEKNEVISHVRSPDSHMPKAEKDKIYVPRLEINEMLKGVSNKLEPIQEDLAWIKNYLLTSK